MRASVLESALKALAMQFAEEIRALGKTDPDLEIEISLRVIPPPTGAVDVGEPTGRPPAGEGAVG